MAALVGLTLASAAVGLARVTFRGGEISRPSSDPVPAPTSSPGLWSGRPSEPILEVGFEDVYSDEYIQGLACCPARDTTWVAGLLLDTADLGFASRPFISVGPAAPGTERTSIVYQPDMRAAAEEIRNEVFPEAEVRVGKPRYDHDLQVDLGRDFVEGHRFEVEAISRLEDFLQRRQEGRGAEPYVSEEVAARYERGEEGLSLYRYASRSAMEFQHVKLGLNGELVEIAIVPIWGETPYIDDTGPLVEVLQVGWVKDSEAPGGRSLRIVGVHRDTFEMDG